jgi:hypothetical protein
MARKPPFEYVNIHGQPLGRPGELRRPAPSAAPRPAARPPSAPVHQPTAADLEAVHDALCLAGSPRGKTFVMNLLRGLGHRTERGARLSLPELTLALDILHAAGRLTLDEDHGYAATDAAARRRRDELLADDTAPAYARLWLWAHGGAYGEPVGWRGTGYIGDRAQAVAWLRLLVYGRGVDDPKSFNLAMAPMRSMLSVEILAQALCEPFSPALFERLNLPLRMGLLSLLDHGLGHGAPVWRPLQAWLDERLAKAPEELPAALRMTLAEGRLHRGDIAGMDAALAGLQSPALPLFAAARQAQRGQWAEAAATYAEAHKALCKALGRRRHVAPYGLLWLYPLSLAAQPAVVGWTQARKFCVAESGSRTPEPFDTWGLWAHALGVRLGDDALDPAAFTYRENPSHTSVQAELLALRLLLSAWLGHRPSHWTHAAVASVLAVLDESGQWLLADLARQAAERLGLSYEKRVTGYGDLAPMLRAI